MEGTLDIYGFSAEGTHDIFWILYRGNFNSSGDIHFLHQWYQIMWAQEMVERYCYHPTHDKKVKQKEVKNTVSLTLTPAKAIFFAAKETKK